MSAVPSFLEHPVFQDALRDIEALGVGVSAHPVEGAIPYAVIGGRSNARWWLLPLENRHVTVSGLAMFQPLLASGQWMKRGVIGLSRLGLGWLWARPALYLSGRPAIASYFGEGPLSFACFTGTDSPHRKVAIQVMDLRGGIKGYARVTRNPQIEALLAHEAGMLKRLESLQLRTAYVPKVLFSGRVAGCTVLVTDTLKTPGTPTTTQLTPAHVAFLQELVQKTAPAPPVLVGESAKGFRSRLNVVRPHLETAWFDRLNGAISMLEVDSGLSLPSGVSHGDFTPWNTFLVNGHVYAFDWEYSDSACSSGNDIIHFILSQPQTQSMSAQARIDTASAGLVQLSPGIRHEVIPLLLAIYLLTQCFRQIERLPDGMKRGSAWDGAADIAAMIDVLLVAQRKGVKPDLQEMSSRLLES